jgi:hypothetical protein
MLAGLLACGSAAAAEERADDALKFPAGVELVSLTVTVLDHANQPVPGLRAEDFVVEERGQRRPVQLVAWTTESDERDTLGPGDQAETTARDLRGQYLIGFPLDRETKSAVAYPRVKVSVNRKGLVVRHCKYYFFPPERR